jgi:hypothetical protein
LKAWWSRYLKLESNPAKQVYKKTLVCGIFKWVKDDGGEKGITWTCSSIIYFTVSHSVAYFCAWSDAKHHGPLWAWNCELLLTWHRFAKYLLAGGTHDFLDCFFENLT